jgi:hypothetical protein
MAAKNAVVMTVPAIRRLLIGRAAPRRRKRADGDTSSIEVFRVLIIGRGRNASRARA